jgi:hypothetical protein
MYVGKNSAHPATALWESAEEPLRSMASADVLAVLDCCFASTAAVKGSGNQTRAYQLLAASSKDGLTSEPGKDSFTTAFCDSLEELLDESQESMFPLIKLHAKINTKPKQESFLWDRLKQHRPQTFGKIALGRLETNQKRCDSFKETEPEQASLTLRFSLKADEMDDDEVRLLAQNIPSACLDAGLQLRGVEWVRFEQGNYHIIRDVVEQLQRRISASKKRKRSPLRGQDDNDPPRTRSQTTANGQFLTLPERAVSEGTTTSEEGARSGLRTPPRRGGGRRGKLMAENTF